MEEIKKRKEGISKAPISETKSMPKKETRPGFCRECGAYVGAYYSCPWCRSKMPHGTRLRVMQISTLVAVILGLFVIAFIARIDPAPDVDIGDIDATYSNGTVTIKGEITNIDYTVASDESWKTLIFTVEDDTGSIDVKAYTETTDELIEDKNTPALGDKCEVRGSVYIRGSEKYILLESTLHFETTRKTYMTLNASDLYDLYQADPDKYLGKRYKLNGTVTNVGDDEVFFDMDDDVRVFFPDYVRAFSPDENIKVIEGDIVWVEGIAEEYYDTLEILPASMYDVEIQEHGGV